jgi:hypothetical protein
VINQAKNQTVDLAVVRAVSETKGKLAKTTVTNERGRYTLVLPKGFYKIITTKPELKQASPLSIRVKTSLRPRTERIGMIEVGRGENSNIEARNPKPAYRQAGQIPSSNFQLPTPYSQPLVPNSQPHTSNPIRSFSDSGEIVERFGGEIKEIGKNQLMTPLPKEKKDHDIPNWKFT